MDRIIWRCVSLGFGCGIALLMRPGLQAGQQPPPIGGVTGTIALEGTVDQEYKAANTIAVKTLDGVRHLFHLTGKTLVHGGESAGADCLRGLEAGSAVVVHYSDDAGKQTALEVDRVGANGLKRVQGVVTRVDREARTISIQLADGSTQALRLTDRAARDVGKEVDRVAADTTRVVVYYVDEAGQRVAHYFKRVIVPEPQGEAATGGWRDDKPGVRRLLTAQDLPAVAKPTYGLAEVVPIPAGVGPRLPDGFSAERITTSGLHKPRVIRVAPNGDLFVADSMFGAVHVLRIPAGHATPEKEAVFASGLKQPFGIAFYPLGPNPQWVYVADSDGVLRFPYRNGDLEATGKPAQIIEGIPSAHHYARDIVFSPDGSRLFLSVGSGSNIALDMFPEPHWTMIPAPRNVDGLAEWAKSKPLGAAWDTEELRADVLSFDPDGRNLKIVATGLRNCEGMAIQPATGQLWCVVNERDELGDNTPFEYATHVVEGAFYGWPWYYIGGHEDPRQAGARPDLKSKVTTPEVLMQAHSAPLQLAFYRRGNFPAEYQGSAFVTMHGSWNRGQRTGYKVVRLLFDGRGKPTGEYEDFMTGFVVSDNQVWGRPVGIAVANDGSLLVTEDGNGTIWRVTYEGNVQSR